MKKEIRVEEVLKVLTNTQFWSAALGATEPETISGVLTTLHLDGEDEPTMQEIAEFDAICEVVEVVSKEFKSRESGRR